MAKKVTPLFIEEQQGASGGYTHEYTFDADDLTTTATNTAQSITLCTVPKGWVIKQVQCVLTTPFENTADAAFNTTAVSIGDGGSATRYLSSTELNKNGSYITYPKVNTTAYQVTAATPILASFASMTGKALNSLNKGELTVLFRLEDTKVVADHHTVEPVLSK